MLKSLLLLAAIFSLSSCVEDDRPEGSRTTKNNYDIVVIDGCEYIEFDCGYAQCRVYSLTHKGNCSNPIHIYSK